TRRGLFAQNPSHQLPAGAVGIRGDRAGVYDVDVSAMVHGNNTVAAQTQRLPKLLGLVLIDLAAEGVKGHRAVHDFFAFHKRDASIDRPRAPSTTLSDKTIEIGKTLDRSI